MTFSLCVYFPSLQIVTNIVPTLQIVFNTQDLRTVSRDLNEPNCIFPPPFEFWVSLLSIVSPLLLLKVLSHLWNHAFSAIFLLPWPKREPQNWLICLRKSPNYKRDIRVFFSVLCFQSQQQSDPALCVRKVKQKILFLFILLRKNPPFTLSFTQIWRVIQDLQHPKYGNRQAYWEFCSFNFKAVFGQVSEKRYISTSTKYSPQKVLKYKN